MCYGPARRGHLLRVAADQTVERRLDDAAHAALGVRVFVRGRPVGEAEAPVAAGGEAAAVGAGHELRRARLEALGRPQRRVVPLPRGRGRRLLKSVRGRRVRRRRQRAGRAVEVLARRRREGRRRRRRPLAQSREVAPPRRRPPRLGVVEVGAGRPETQVQAAQRDGRGRRRRALELALAPRRVRALDLLPRVRLALRRVPLALQRALARAPLLVLAALGLALRLLRALGLGLGLGGGRLQGAPQLLRLELLQVDGPRRRLLRAGRRRGCLLYTSPSPRD